ncbi:MAG: cell wall-binding protein [Lachnospiraceae bacterium]|nr:cell wall-binding protein [Lachnospiraceae bacterium]
MKKQTKFLAVLSTAAVMAAVTPGLFASIPGLSHTTLAASKAGWTEEDGELRYRDSDGYYLTDTWKKKDNDWYYLDEDGMITRSAMIDEYYVDENGKRIYNQWVSEDNEDWDDESPDTYWYYYGNDGKQVVSRWQNINNNSYYFNEEGHMQTGKLILDNNTYYLGDDTDGAMKTGWIQLENEDDSSDEEMVWHYFDSRGRMVMDQVDYKINGNYYTFEDGILQTGWYKLPATQQEAAPQEGAAENEGTAEGENAKNAEEAAAVQAPAIASYQYYEEDGKRAEGWYQIEGAPEISEEGEIYSFYFKKGRPYHATTGVQTFSIDSKRYGFNTRGEMQTGKQVVTTETGSTANYYFGEDGVMKTGKQTIYNEDLDENQTWFFITDGGNKGQGFHGVRDNNVFDNGLRLDADRDLKYAPVELDGVRYLVNASGSIQKASSSSKSSSRPELGNGFKDLKDANDKIWTVDANGVIQQ